MFRSYTRWSTFAIAAIAVLYGGCGGGLTRDDSEASPPEDPERPEQELSPGCRALDVGQRTGELAHGMMNGGPQTSGPGVCQGGDHDVAYLWKAPRAGCFRLEFWTSTFEHQLRLGRQSCDGQALHCSTSYGSSVTYSAAAGETFVISVSVEASSSRGEYDLAIYEHFGVCG